MATVVGTRLRSRLIAEADLMMWRRGRRKYIEAGAVLWMVAGAGTDLRLKLRGRGGDRYRIWKRIRRHRRGAGGIRYVDK